MITEIIAKLVFWTLCATTKKTFNLIQQALWISFASFRQKAITTAKTPLPPTLHEDDFEMMLTSQALLIREQQATNRQLFLLLNSPCKLKTIDG